MIYRRLGNTDIEVSILAFGAWGIGGRTDGATSYGETDDNVSLRALRHALASGITLFDTSNVYGAGHSETLLGRAFQSDRNSVAIATKVGWPSYSSPADFSPEGMRKSVEGSLRRLQTDYIDLLQLHNPPVSWVHANPDILETLRSFVAEGKVRTLGISARSPEDAAVLGDETELAAVQANFNMMDIRVVISGLLDELSSRKQSLIGRTPLCFGFLSGQIDRTTTFADGDHRGAWSIGQRERWIEGSELFNTIVERYGAAPLHRAALRFCLGFSGVASVLTGMLRESEVDENVAAVNLGPLPDQLVQEILALHQHRSFFERSPDDQLVTGAVLAKK